MRPDSLLKNALIASVAVAATSAGILTNCQAATAAGAAALSQTQSQGRSLASAHTQPQRLVYQTASSRGAEPATYLGTAKRLYQVHRYADAANYFRQAIQKEGAGSGGYLWLAHCLYAMGDLNAAIPEYKHIVDTYIGTAEAKQAAQYLAKLDPTGKLQSTGAVASRGPSTTFGGGAVTGSLDGNIEIVRPIIGHPAVSPATISLVQANVRRLPAAVQGLLQQKGIKFCVTPTLIDKFPNLAFQEGRGYDGHTYKSCPGMFSNNTVIICERFVNESSDEVEAPRPPSLITDNFFHEVGHAIDVCLGNLSSKDDYRHAYLLDIARIPPDAANRLAYFMQKSTAGQQESMGEIAGVCLGGCDQTRQDIQTYFPLTMSVIKQNLEAGRMLEAPGGQIAGRSTSGHM